MTSVPDRPTPATAQRFVFASRPSGMPTAANFRLEEIELAELAAGQVRIENHFITVDPGMRSRMNGGASYVPGLQFGDRVGLAAVGRVVASMTSDIVVGDWVFSLMGWQDRGIAESRDVRVIRETRLPPSTAAGVLGIPGLTAYFGMLDLAKPVAGETVVVTSAAGGVGSAAGQIAQIHGCRVIGIAGGPEKCRWLTEELGFAAAIDYQASPDIGQALAAACPEGVDILFDNVGNAMVDRVLPHMRNFGRVTISGQTADYVVAPAQRHGIQNTSVIIGKRLTIRGLVAFDYAARFPEALAAIGDWIIGGKLKYREDIDLGFERLPEAFAGLFTGKNFGRKLVELHRPA